MTEGEFEKLRAKSREAAEAASEARGALIHLEERLRAEFGAGSVSEARIKLEKMTARRDETKKEFERMLSDYQKEFSE